MTGGGSLQLLNDGQIAETKKVIEIYKHVVIVTVIGTMPLNHIPKQIIVRTNFEIQIISLELCIAVCLVARLLCPGNLRWCIALHYYG